VTVVCPGPIASADQTSTGAGDKKDYEKVRGEAWGVGRAACGGGARRAARARARGVRRGARGRRGAGAGAGGGGAGRRRARARGGGRGAAGGAGVPGRLPCFLELHSGDAACKPRRTEAQAAL